MIKSIQTIQKSIDSFQFFSLKHYNHPSASTQATMKLNPQAHEFVPANEYILHCNIQNNGMRMNPHPFVDSQNQKVSIQNIASNNS